MKIDPSDRDLIEVRVSGIPALAHVDYYFKQKPWGNKWTAPSDADYYGYEELGYTLFDRKGYRATWLDDKLEEPNIEQDVREQILEEINRQRQEAIDNYLETLAEEKDR